MKLLARFLIIFVVTFVMTRFLHLGSFNSIWSLAIFSVVLMAVNHIIRPIVRIISLPITIITLGIFYFVINVLMILLADKLVSGIHFNGFFAAMVISLGISIVSSFIRYEDKEAY
ncbi:phage holin family protein [uncultured Clostridium sp.]|uniref:phage holin family protein n=1 Tax=uncultured Clostridium sp. TaxID=59620 RepID=UPI00260225F8|nr:phage holin family protein [uncultured Clostridium sp.]